MPIPEILTWVLRVGLGGVFVVAGVLKLGDPNAFTTEIANYRFLAPAAPLAAATLPAIEILVGVGVIAFPRSWRTAATLVVLILLAIFTGAAAQAIVRGIDVDCGCFGSHSGPVTMLTIVRDCLMLGAAGFLLWRDLRAA